MNKKVLVLVGGAIVFKDSRGRRLYLIIKQNKEDDWEFPKVTVRKGESSVRAVLRMTGEMAGISAKVLEEAGRSSGAATVNGKVIPQKYYYYLMLLKSGGSDVIGYENFKWWEYGKVIKALHLKREKDIFRQAKGVLKLWEKKHPKRKNRE